MGCGTGGGVGRRVRARKQAGERRELAWNCEQRRCGFGDDAETEEKKLGEGKKIKNKN